MPLAENPIDADPARHDPDYTTLRDELRSATGADHAVLDQSMAELRLAEPADLVRFLGTHLAARAGIEAWLEENAPSGWAPPLQTGLITDDLIALGGLPAAFPAPPFDPGPSDSWLGPAYVVAGSHLGNRLLLAQAGTALPRDAQRFLAGKAMQEYWRRLRTRLAGMPGPDGGAGAIEAAKATFGHFTRCVALFGLSKSAAA